MISAENSQFVAQKWFRVALVLGSVTVSVIFLSAAPHQEPRFLLPLLPLVAVICGPYIFTRKSLLFVWFAINAALFVMMGVMHQGGVIPSLHFIDESYREDLMIDDGIAKEYNYIYYHTYIPPSFLVRSTYCLQNDSKNISTRVFDLQGAPTAKLAQFIDLLNNTASARASSIASTRVRNFVVLPRTAHKLLGHLKFTLIKCFWPHLSMESPPSIFSGNLSEDLCLDLVEIL